MTEELTEQNINHAIDKVAEFIDKIIAPPFKQVGGILEDQVRFWRLKNQVRIVQKAEAYFVKKKIEPVKVPLKILAPLLEYGSLEEDEMIQDKWAALLIHAADPEQSNDFAVIFVELLKQLTALEVAILDKIYNQHLASFEVKERDDFMKGMRSMTMYVDIDEYFETELGNLQNKVQSDLVKLNLERLNIVEYFDQNSSKHGIKAGLSLKGDKKEIKGYFLSTLGVAFIRACRGEYNEYSMENIRIMKISKRE